MKPIPTSLYRTTILAANYLNPTPTKKPMDTELVFKIRNLKKRFGNRNVLRGIDLDIYKGEVLGLIGRSGSGKTTLLHSMIGFLQPDAGDVEILVEPTHRALGNPTYKNVIRNTKAAKRVYGFASQIPSFYDNLTVRENLEYFGSLYQIPKNIIKTNAEILLDLMNLNSAQKMLAKNLSGGMERRLDIALALMHDPAVLLLDEPTADLDPILRKQIYKLIKKINEKETTVILASHHISELEEVCDRIAVLKDGRVLAVGTPDQIRKRFSRSMKITLKTANKDYKKTYEKFKPEIHKDSLVFTSQDPEQTIKDIMQTVEKAKHKIELLSAQRPTLAEIFVSIIEGKDNE